VVMTIILSELCSPPYETTLEKLGSPAEADHDVRQSAATADITSMCRRVSTVRVLCSTARAVRPSLKHAAFARV
jgi:hypothetical protein